jgi:hypothetical protein
MNIPDHHFAVDAVPSYALGQTVPGIPNIVSAKFGNSYNVASLTIWHPPQYGIRHNMGSVTLWQMMNC